jgi:hypothetical protein
MLLLEKEDAMKPRLQTAIFGTTSNVVPNDNGFHWRKTGGYAGEKTLSRIIQRAIAAGYTKADEGLTGTPDGSHMGSGQVYVGPNKERLVINSSYGVTKERNYFSATLTRNG